MALSGTGLATAITAIPGITVTNPAELQAFCNALINYLTTNAVITSFNFITTDGVPVVGTGRLT